MKKYLYIFGFAGIVLFTACSTADDLIAEKPIETPADNQTSETILIAEASQNSDVPITMGVSQSRGLTRAPIGGEGDPANPVVFSTEAGKYLGVFCLATDYQSSNHPIGNDWSADDESGLIVRMSNVPAKVEAGAVTFLDSLTLSNSTPSEMAYYYPISNWMKYNFYAYYPRQEETYITASGKYKDALVFKPDQALEKFYEIDGSQDIVWGMANPDSTIYSNAPNMKKPYCASFFRWKKDSIARNNPGENIANYYPELKFEHELAQLRFYVKAADAAALAVIGPDGLGMKVTDMYIANALYRLSLIVANKATPSKNGQLSKFSDETTTFHIKANDSDDDRFVDGNSDGQVDDPLEITTASAETVMAGDPVGYIMLAPPSIKDGFKYQLVVNLKYTGGTNAATINLEPPVIPGTDPEKRDFEPGKIYNIIVNIQSPEVITVKAVLQGWETYTYNDGVEDKNYIEY